ncbi:hypothetical protein L7F22_055387 [Adiantum nelumboides]|nr:hypothetical protein [Adiantum nelumboides]
MMMMMMMKQSMQMKRAFAFEANMLMVGVMMMMMAMNIVAGSSIEYDGRGLLFDAQPKLLISGSIHYPRSTPQMWGDLISKAKEGGLDVVQTYVFWNAHEPEEGNYNFDENLDLLKFLSLVQEAGLYVNLRIGPFIEAEWNFGGLPVWLYLQEGAVMRTNNTIFMEAMQKFTTKIVQMMKEQNMFLWQGGPIIMAQIENEFGAYEKNTSAYAYAMWAANMAVGLNTSVPWIMCKQPDAPDPVINTHNGVTNGDKFQPNAPYKPKMWTEFYTGWFQTYKKPKPLRSPTNIAFEVARFFVSNGSFVNYYMWGSWNRLLQSPADHFTSLPDSCYDLIGPLISSEEPSPSSLLSDVSSVSKSEAGPGDKEQEGGGLLMTKRHSGIVLKIFATPSLGESYGS